MNPTQTSRTGNNEPEDEVKDEVKEVAINACYGGFSLSTAAYLRLIELGMKALPYTEEGNCAEGAEISIDLHPLHSMPSHYADWNRPESRSDSRLIQMLKELGPAANGACAKIIIVPIPRGTEYEIGEYDGMEHIAEKHRKWFAEGMDIDEYE